jgi:hypothetical protein
VLVVKGIPLAWETLLSSSALTGDEVEQPFLQESLPNSEVEKEE